MAMSRILEWCCVMCLCDWFSSSGDDGWILRSEYTPGVPFVAIIATELPFLAGYGDGAPAHNGHCALCLAQRSL